VKINKQEFKAMKARIKELEMDNVILKKATAIFAKKHQKQKSTLSSYSNIYTQSQ